LAGRLSSHFSVHPCYLFDEEQSDVGEVCRGLRLWQYCEGGAHLAVAKRIGGCEMLSEGLGFPRVWNQQPCEHVLLTTASE